MRFSVEPEHLKSKATAIDDYRNELNVLKFQITGCRYSISVLNMPEVVASLDIIQSSIQLGNKRLIELENALGAVASAYSDCENIICSTYSGSVFLTSHSVGLYDSVESPAYDDIGTYGGRQASPLDNYADMAWIVRKYYPKMSDKQIMNYLKKLNSEGCGYVAMVNTIFAQFIGKENEFERTFGFSMTKADGELNYEAVITDFYSATDNHHKFLFWDFNYKNEDSSEIKGVGTTRATREYRWEKYCHDHGIKVDVHNVEVSAENYEKLFKNGEIVVGLSPVIIYDENGIQYSSDGGHAMTVTGVTEDGRFIVSSWGRKYFLDSDLSVYSDHITFQQVTYK